MYGRKLDSGVLILVAIDVGIIVSGLVAFPSSKVDKFSLIAIVGVSVVVLNGMFFWIRKTDRDLPKEHVRRINRWILWPVFALGAAILLFDFIVGSK